MWNIGCVPLKEQFYDLAFPAADNKIKEGEHGLMNKLFSFEMKIHRKCKGFRPVFSDSKLFSNFKRTQDKELLPL